VSLYFALEEWKDDKKRRPAIWVINPYLLNEKTLEDRDITLPRYLGEIKKEEWDFGEMLADYGRWPWDRPAAIYPIQLNERVRVQRGWFTIHGNDRRPLEDQVPECVVKLVLGADCISEVREFVRLAGFNKFSIYPDLEHLAALIREERLQWADKFRGKRQRIRKTRLRYRKTRI
jgi:hypothetical protein